MQGHAASWLWFGLLVWTAGCSIVSPSNSDGDIEFGDPYEIRRVDPVTGQPADPKLDMNILTTLVSYSGGCRDHAFELRSTTRSDTASVWLVHDADGDLCEAYITEELQIRVPESVSRAEVQRLLDPNGPPIAL
jgi:hypothetical protein